MEISRKDYTQHFSLLSDEALLDVNADDLVIAARECLEEELAKRGLAVEHEAVEEDPEFVHLQPAGDEPPNQDPLIVIGEYLDPGEADLALTLLRGGDVRAVILHERNAGQLGLTVSPGVFQLAVRDSMAELANEILASEISEEELAAQAEAAGAEHSELLDFARRYTEAWCSQDPASVADCYSPDGSLTINDGAPAIGHAAITEAARAFMRAFPDLHVAMDDLSIQGQTVVYHWTLTGANTGPGGKGHQVQISGFEEWILGEDGWIAESHGHFDEAEYERQINGAK